VGLGDAFELAQQEVVEPLAGRAFIDLDKLHTWPGFGRRPWGKHGFARGGWPGWLPPACLYNPFHHVVAVSV
jgi:hypothetical protein